MRKLLVSSILIPALVVPGGVGHAQDTNQLTATRKGGTSFSGTKRTGACRGHGGVQSWGTTPAAAGGHCCYRAACGGSGNRRQRQTHLLQWP